MDVQVPRQRVIFGDVTDPLLRHLDWLRLRGLRPSSIESRRNALLRTTCNLGCELVDATAADLARWQGTLRVSPVAHSAYVSHLRQFYAWCVKVGLLRDDPSTPTGAAAGEVQAGGG